jgi:hypothetical protein
MTDVLPVNIDAPAPAPEFARGEIVEHHWDDVLDGPSSRAGVVLAVLEGDAPRVIVGWLAGVSGPITASELSAWSAPEA